MENYPPHVWGQKLLLHVSFSLPYWDVKVAFLTAILRFCRLTRKTLLTQGPQSPPGFF